MSELALTASQPSQPVPTKQTRHHAPKVTGKVALALSAMVWDGLPRKEAAAAAGISEHGLYKALRKPAVKAHYLSELEVLRTSERARNFHALIEVRDQKGNAMARVNAVKSMEQLSDDQMSVGAMRAAPGLTIVVVQAAATQAPAPTISTDYAEIRALDETAP